MKRHQKGFTLLEMVTVLTVICILTMGAVPLYELYYSRSKRAEIFLISQYIIKTLDLRRHETVNRSKAEHEDIIEYEGGGGVYGWAEVQGGERKHWDGLNIRFDGSQRYSYRVDYWQITYPGGEQKNSIVIEAIAEGKYDIDRDDTPDQWVITNDNGYTATNVIDDTSE